MNILYPAKITHDQKDGRYTVEFVDFPEAITEGVTLEEAIFNASEALTLTLEGRLDEGIDIPKPSAKKRGTHLIAPSARVQAALLVKLSRGTFSTSELARALETSWPAASRFEDPHHWPSLRQLEKVMAVMGKKLVLSTESLVA
jgi:antitoxin HicB